MKPTQITSIDELKKACSEDCESFFIQLNYGMRSSKTISYNQETDEFWVLNEIDDTEQTLKAQELDDRNLTNIGLAIRNGAFYKHTL